MRRNKKKKIIIISLIGILILMTVGYAAFQTNLNIKGTSSISSNWDIIISNIEKVSYGGEAEEAKVPTGIGTLTADMEVNLYQKGDFIEYDVTVLNRGTIDAVLSNISPSEREYIDSNNEAIKISFSGVNINDKLLKGDTHHLKVRIEYNPEFTGTPKEGSVSLEIGLEYTQAEMAGVPTINPNLYVSSNGDDTKGNGSKSNPYLTLSKAYTEAGDNSTIYIMNDITQTEILNLNEDKNITITSDGTRHSIIRGSALTEYFIVMSLGTINLKDIIVDGNKVESLLGNISLKGEVTLNLYSGSVIKNAISTRSSGAGIKLWDDTFSTLNINGGSILNNESKNGLSSGGIHSGPNTTVMMYSGSISDNIAASGGGGISTFGILEISGGTISDNSANNGGGIIVTCFEGKCGNASIKGGAIFTNSAKNGGGIYNAGGKVIVDGGEIHNNSVSSAGGGIFNSYHQSNSLLEIRSGKINNNISDFSGGGISNAGILNIIGGDIYSNSAKDNGGGVSGASDSQIIMTGGVIRNNIAPLGGGITVYAQTNYTSSFTLKGGTIKDNISTSSHGGIYVSGVGSYTRVSGIVCGNKPTNSYETHTTCPAS